MRVVGSQCHFAHVDVAVAHGHHGKVFFAHAFAGRREFGHRSARRGFGGLSSGVGVDFGVKHKDVDVFAGGDDVVESAVADVVGPAVSSDAPD